MIINIFGVGRSGTKSLQLFIAYCLLQKHQQIRINYEPYFWGSRLLKVKSFDGIKHHLTTKHFSDSIEDFNSEHQNFLKNLCEGEVVVNKFIRGNGRIAPIAEITQADYNILLVRDLESVLESVNREQFNFHSIGSKFEIDFYDKLINEASEQGLLESVKNELDIYSAENKNALVWYTYNAHAKRNKHLIIIEYDKMLDPKYLAKKLNFLGVNEELFNLFSSLRGNKIHKQEILVNQNVVNQNNFLNKLLFYSFFRISKHIPFFKENIQDFVSLNKTLKLTTNFKPKLRIEKQSFSKDFSLLNDMIFNFKPVL